MPHLSKYGVARKIRIPMVKRAVVDHAVGADWTPAAGDVKISKDGGAAANVTNLPTAIAMGNSAIWEFSLTAAEMQAAQINVTVADSATKAVEDTGFDIETYGDAAGQHQVDLADSVRAGLTALPNAAAEAAGGLYTRGAGAGQIAQTTNGTIDTAVTRWGGNAVAATVVNGVPIVDAKYFLGTAITEGGAGRIAGAVTKFFDKAAPTGTINSLPDAVPGAAGGLLIDDVWTDARAAKLDNLDAAITSRMATFALPANFGALAITAGGAVTVGTNNDKVAYTLTAAYDLAKTAAQAGDAMTLTVAERNSTADALLNRDMSVGADTVRRSVRNALRVLLNKWTIAAGVRSVYKEDDVTVAWTSAVTGTPGADPVTADDPA